MKCKALHHALDLKTSLGLCEGSRRMIIAKHDKVVRVSSLSNLALLTPSSVKALNSI